MSRTFLVTLAGIAASFLAVLLYPASLPASAAQASCTSLGTTVTSEQELVRAFGCFNSQAPAGNHTITFASDITITNRLPAVTLDDSTVELSIVGNGYTLTGTGRGTRNLIKHNSSASLAIDALTIEQAATAVSVSDGVVRVSRSVIQDSSWGMKVTGGRVVVSSSTILEINTGIEVETGSVLVSNSTVVDGELGLKTSGASAAVVIANSTFTASNPALWVQEGSAELVSSIVEGICRVDPVRITDSGNNFAQAYQSCGSGLLSPGSLALTAADNGCVEIGCTPTVALLASSSAFNGGRCTSVPVGLNPDGTAVLGDLIVDQRGVARATPCQPGAFEVEPPPPPVCDGFGVSTVSTEAELVNAIRCFNAGDPSGEHAIDIAADFSVEPLPEIVNDDPFAVLYINGDGHVLSGLPTEDAIFKGLVRHDSPSGLRIENVTIEHEGGRAVEVAQGTVEIERSTLRNSEWGLLVTGGEVQVEQSVIELNSKGVDVRGGSVEVHASTIGPGAWGVLISSGDVRVTQSTLTGHDLEGLDVGNGTAFVSSSTFDDSAIAIWGGSTLVSNSTISTTDTLIQGIEVWDGSLVLANSTVHGAANADVANYGASFEIISSIIDTRCDATEGPLDITGKAFAPVERCGDEFAVLSPGSLADALAANGCSGDACTETVELLPDSSAVDQGLCSGVPVDITADGSLILGDLQFDQRGQGFPRVLGSACDAGAFEAVPGEGRWSCAATSLVVAERELNAAIDCFNNQTPAGDHTVTLGADIALTAQLNPVTADSGDALTLQGANHVVQRARAACCDSVIVKLVGSADLYLERLVLDTQGEVALQVGADAGEMWVVDSSIAGSVDVDGGTFVLLRSELHDVAGVGIDAAGQTVSVYRSLIRDVEKPIVLTDGLLGVGYSIIKGDPNFSAIEVVGTNAATAEILGSAIYDADAAVYLSSTSSTVLITNSTLWANDTGVQVWWGDVTITNSTIAVGSRAINGPAERVTVVSSILVTEDDCPRPYAGANNFSRTTGCGDGFTLLTASDFANFGLFRDHGCTYSVATPWGCTASLELLDGHSALGAGKCDNVQVRYNETGPLELDQGGLPRNPSDCDAGAFEAAVRCDGEIVTHDLNMGDSGTGTAGDDVFLGTPGNDVIRGLGGNDTICSGAGHDTVYAGPGDDYVFAGWGADKVYGGHGNDVIYGEGNSDFLVGGIGDDFIDGGSKSDRIYGDNFGGGSTGGHDRLYGGVSGSDLIYGGAGNDVIDGGIGSDRLFGQQGVDTIAGGNGNDKIYGGSGNDVLSGGNNSDKIWGETGHDIINGNAGDDLWLDGDEHNDKVYGGNGHDIVRGGDGRDKVYGQGGNDDVRAQAGDDWAADGGAGTDNCQVAPGNDVPAINCEP